MALSKGLKADVQRWLLTKNVKAISVTNIRDVNRSTGFCETCYDSWVEAHVDYVDENGENKTYEYYGDMGSLIRDLTDDED